MSAYFVTMSSVQEIESAIAQLEPSEVHTVADWLQEQGYGRLDSSSLMKLLTEK